MSTAVARAMEASATIMIMRRFQRSTNVPANGPKRIWGSTATRVAVASTVAEPVFCVSHQTSENCTIEDPNRENACPTQMVKKRPAHFPVSGCVESIKFVFLYGEIVVYNRRCQDI